MPPDAPTAPDAYGADLEAKTVPDGTEGVRASNADPQTLIQKEFARRGRPGNHRRMAAQRTWREGNDEAKKRRLQRSYARPTVAAYGKRTKTLHALASVATEPAPPRSGERSYRTSASTLWRA